jgi:hypothetical protein
MEIEETIQRQLYRGFDLVQLRQKNATESRWQVSHQESGTNRNYGFVNTEKEAQTKIDDLLKRRSDAKEPKVIH